MPYIIIKTQFPFNKAREVAEHYIEEKKKYPTDKSLRKNILEGALKVSGNVIKSLNVIEVKTGKLDEALIKMQNIMIDYHDIEGYQYEMEVYFNLGEAMGLIGMKPPK